MLSYAAAIAVESGFVPASEGECVLISFAMNYYQDDER